MGRNLADNNNLQESFNLMQKEAVSSNKQLFKFVKYLVYLIFLFTIIDAVSIVLSMVFMSQNSECKSLNSIMVPYLTSLFVNLGYIYLIPFGLANKLPQIAMAIGLIVALIGNLIFLVIFGLNYDRNFDLCYLNQNQVWIMFFTPILQIFINGGLFKGYYIGYKYAKIRDLFQYMTFGNLLQMKIE
ncbi:hypothetical protein PPERSA_00150 [Pseudocohnilembus persalinus]|uniref:Transmembrane protein n=1 Tax=Pseudocohnilembus persalinus TaxID=266149 RepID=A0A0V0QHM2_PSEPJ|nr:hypothetical protein PPERSA_00150 [Pseudocohnilembus persalinus]|eukprot:KRX01777.1 hypothetical protein PPERSA_00150 [Pseudocohnilembus persalinus]